MPCSEANAATGRRRGSDALYNPDFLHKCSAIATPYRSSRATAGTSHPRGGGGRALRVLGAGDADSGGDGGDREDGVGCDGGNGNGNGDGGGGNDNNNGAGAVATVMASAPAGAVVLTATMLAMTRTILAVNAPRHGRRRGGPTGKRCEEATEREEAIVPRNRALVS